MTTAEQTYGDLPEGTLIRVDEYRFSSRRIHEVFWEVVSQGEVDGRRKTYLREQGGNHRTSRVDSTAPVLGEVI